MNASISVSSRPPLFGVDADGMARQEEVGLVVIELRPLVLGQRVFDRELVQAELVLRAHRAAPWTAAKVDPHEGVRLLEIFGHIGDRKVLRLEDPASIHPRMALTHAFLRARCFET